MIRRAEEMAIEIREGMRGGAGQVKIQHIFGKDELKGKCRLCANLYLEPGHEIGFHEHNDEEEVFYIIKGEGVMDDGETQTPVAAGDGILTPSGEGHSLKNTGQEPMEILAVILVY